MTGEQLPLFVTAPSSDPVIGLTVALDRAGDRLTPCHDNLAVIGSSAGPHAHALRCAVCGRHRGWLPAAAARFIADTVRLYGVPPEPPIIRNASTTPTRAPDMRISNIFPSRHLRAADLQGLEHHLTIEGVTEEEVGTDRKPVVRFIGRQKALTLNKTNSYTLARAYGDDTDAWAGKPVTLYETLIDFRGTPTPTIRVKVPTHAISIARPPDSKPEATQALAELNDEVPF